MKEADVVLNFKGGGSIVSHKPLFSADGQNTFVCWKDSLFEYNTKTGKLLHEYKGNSGQIIGFSIHTYDSYECLVCCTESGKVIIWKTVTQFKILEKQLPAKKLKTFDVIPSEDPDELRALISHVEKQHILFSVIDVKKKACRTFKFTIKLDEHRYFIDISRNNYFSVAHGRMVYFIHLNNFKEISRYFIHESRTFTCIACHSDDDIVLTGDSSGRVTVWQNIFSRATRAVFHWHTLPVRTVCFSTAGSYFYSGGEECVVVKWQFYNANDRRFLPRLGADIEHISVATNNLYVAVATSDNTIRILDAQMNIITLMQHLIFGKQYENGMVYDPRTRALIMNGNHGHIQFYSPNEMTLLYSVDVVCQNKITNERDCVIQNTEVSKIAISKSGVWLATVEERKDKEYHNEIRLKFWKFIAERQTFELNTVVEYPHEKSINNILFQPLSKDDGLHCVTVGDDYKFKVWQLYELTTVYKTGAVWKCFDEGSYRDLLCFGLSFSIDGSLIAVGFNAILTTWTVDSCDLKCSLIHPKHMEKIKHIQFGYSNQCHLLVSASANQMSVWNLLTLSMIWTVPINVGLLVADPYSTNMAVLTQDKKVYVFTPASKMPSYTNENLLKKQGKIVAATFIPTKYSNDAKLKWYERSHLYFINSKNELFDISKNEYNSMEMIADVLDDNKSIMRMVLPNSKFSLAESVIPTRHLYEEDVEQKTLKEYLESPIHTTPPIRFVCHSLIKSLVIQKESVS